MIAATPGEQKKLKFTFFAVYIISVVLIIVILASVWKTDATASRPVPIIHSSGVVTSADKRLHAKMESLDQLYSRAFASNQTGVLDTINLSLAKKDFKNTLDSLDVVGASISDTVEKNELTSLLSYFRKEADARITVANNYLALLSDSTGSVTATTNRAANEAALEELKAILIEKEQRIAALEKNSSVTPDEKDKQIAALQRQVNQLKAAPVQTVTVSGDGEWKQKYNALKSAHDKAVAQNNTLNNSYQSLVDDNRRLLAQLQAARKE
jgi:hypothetical protein